MPGKTGSRPALFASLWPYRRQWLRGDLVAGLTVWAVLVPEALAYASIAGVSPVVGLYAAPGALLLYAAFGSSRTLVAGPMAATAALSAAAVGDVAAGDAGVFAALTVTLALTTGILALGAGLLRFGFVANLISEPVLKGFIIGLALTIIAGQIPKLLGIPKGPGEFFGQLWSVATHLGRTHWLTFAVGLGSLLIVLGIRRFLPIVPGPLVAVMAGIIAVSAFDLTDRGVVIVGHIDGGFPPLGLPDVAVADYLRLAGPAVGVMVIAFVEGLGAAKTYAARDGYQISPNRELAGLGAANIAAGLSSGMVVNGSLSKTAVNGSAGARTQMSGLFVGVLTVITLLWLTGLFENLPEATLAAVVIAALVKLVDLAAIRTLYRASTTRLTRIYGFAARADFLAALAALFGVLLFDTLPGLAIGMVVSMMLLLYRVSRPHVAALGQSAGDGEWVDVARHPEHRTDPAIRVLRVESGVFFANADHVRDEVEQAALEDGVTAVVLDCAMMPFLDVSAARMLDQLATDLRHRGVRLLLAGEIGQVRDITAVVSGGVAESERYRTVGDAVAAARQP
jgi:SulP family sulfate permease